MVACQLKECDGEGECEDVNRTGQPPITAPECRHCKHGCDARASAAVSIIWHLLVSSVPLLCDGDSGGCDSLGESDALDSWRYQIMD